MTTPDATVRQRSSRFAMRIAGLYALMGGVGFLIIHAAISWLTRKHGIITPIEILEDAAYLLITALALWRLARWYLIRIEGSTLALTQSRAQLERILETMAEGLVLFDPQGKITLANTRAEAILHLSRGDLAKRTFNDPAWKITAADGGPFPESELAVSRVMQTRAPVYGVEHAIACPDGQRIVISLNAAPLTDAQEQLTGIIASVSDITEAKRAADAIRKEKDLAQKYFNLAGVIMLALDARGNISLMNQKGLEVLGYQENELVGRNWFDQCVPSRNRDQVKATFALLMSGELAPAEYFENQVVTKTGALRLVAWHNTILRDDGGRIIGTLSSGEDITERRRAEAAHRESEERYRTLVETSPDAIILTDLSTRIIMANAQALMLYGAEAKEELLGKTGLDLVAPEDRERAVRDMAITLSRRRHRSLEYNFLRKEGTPFPVDLRISAIPDPEGNPRYFIAVFRDITDRRRAEAALRESEERYRAVVEDQTELICRFRPDFTLTFVNGAYARYFGRRIEELAGINFLTLILPEDRERVKENLRGLSRENPLESHEERVLLSDGRVRWQVWTNRAIFDPAGQPVEYQAVGRDVTAQRALEEELAKAQKLESLGILAGGIAHDFNNILTAILGNISLARLFLREDGDIRDPSERLSEAERACLRARGLTQQLLTFSRGGTPITATASLQELLAETARFALRGSPVRCEFEFAAELWPVKIDESQIGQVIHNLMINAAQAMPEGGTIRVRADNLELTAADAQTLPLRPGPYVKVAVADRGIGIAPEHLSKIFDPFFTTKQTGSGLGLTISFAIIKRHDGLLLAESTLGQGATFIFYLPAVPEALAPPAPEPEKPVPGQGRVLVMDDEEVIRELLAIMLRDLGYDAEFAADGKTAVARFQQARDAGRPFDAVILDLTVPGGMGGKETAQALLALEPAVRIIISSGYSTDPIMSDYQNYGVQGVVAKPYKPEEMSSVLQKVMKKGSDE